MAHIEDGTRATPPAINSSDGTEAPPKGVRPAGTLLPYLTGLPNEIRDLLTPCFACSLSVESTSLQSGSVSQPTFELSCWDARFQQDHPTSEEEREEMAFLKAWKGLENRHRLFLLSATHPRAQQAEAHSNDAAASWLTASLPSLHNTEKEMKEAWSDATLWRAQKLPYRLFLSDSTEYRVHTYTTVEPEFREVTYHIQLRKLPVARGAWRDR